MDLAPYLPLLGGSVIGYTCMLFLTSIIDFNLAPNDSLQVSFFVIGIVSFVIGGFYPHIWLKKKNCVMEFTLE